MNPFISHPSVRIRGTENNYEPTSCINSKCPKSWPHMHCPFCVKTEVFQDPVILKAHYRVKHVDKGIEFAGLKILRCCERCEIVGTIKGSKEFKGAHWHCYKCRNGFTRRDEAIKHFRTHFRNPSTTFQIQVAQDINQSAENGSEDTMRAFCSMKNDMTLDIETVGTTATMDDIDCVQPDSPVEAMHAESPETGKQHSGEIQVSVAANETVGTCEGQSFMILQDGTHLQDGEILGTLEAVQPPAPKSASEIIQKFIVPVTPETPRVTGHWRQEKAILENQLKKIKLDNSNLIAERQQFEHQMGIEIENLKVQLQVANEEILAYQKREAELVSQLKIPLDDRINDLLSDLKNQHEELLHHQLAQLRRVYLHQLHDELTQKSSNPTDQLLSAKDVHMTIVRPAPTDNITPVIATMSGTNNVVLTAPEGYATLPTGSLNTENIVLTSEALIADGNSGTPLFVMSQPTLQDIKNEQCMESEQTEMMDTVLLEADDPQSSLVQYTHASQEEVVLTAEDQLVQKALLETSEVSDSECSHAETVHVRMNPLDNSVELHTETLSTTGKRKLQGDQHNYNRAKQYKIIQ